MIAISVNLGGSKTCVAGFSRAGFFGATEVQTPLTGSPKVLPKLIRKLCLDILRNNNCDCAGPVHVGISVAGFREPGFHSHRFFASNICYRRADDGSYLNNWPFLDFGLLKSGLFESVTVSNDVIAETAAEHRWGVTKGIDNFIYVNWGTGIGMGLFADGRLIKGKNGNASHGGHQYVGPFVEPETCGCGRTGDIEAMSGGRFLERRWGGETGTLFDAYKQQNAVAIQIVESAVESVMIGVSNLCIALDTSIMCFGGGLYLNHKDVLRPLMISELGKVPEIFKAGVKLQDSALGASGAKASGLAVIPKGAIPWLDSDEYELNFLQ